MQQALAYTRDHLDRFTTELEDLLRIPSISTDSAYKADVRRCADWLVDHLVQIGFTTAEAIETGGHPVVYAEHTADPSKPTVLVYGHYDVQPPIPSNCGTRPRLSRRARTACSMPVARATTRDKCLCTSRPPRRTCKARGDLPVNLKLLLEGEEESGSAHLAPFIEKNQDRLAADVVVVSDTSMFAPGVPSITYGLRGLAYVEITLEGPNRDLHSGIYGGAIENPINALAQLIAGLHDKDHRIAVAGFYEDVRDLTDEERATFRKLPFDEAEWKASVGVADVRHEASYTTLEAISARPTLDVNGIWGGYTGEGAKTVLPSKASAKISMRLVPDQRPADIVEKLKAYLEAKTPSTMKLHFHNLHGGNPALIDTDSPAMQAAAEAMEGVYGRPPYFTREGGSIPVVADFKRILGLDTVLMGFGLDSDAIHSPNEHFGLDRFDEGIRSIVRFLSAFGEREG